MSRLSIFLTLARVFCGIVFIVHGMPKIFNLSAAAEQFSLWGFPAWSAVPVAVIEFFGGILLVAGFLSRILAGIFAVEMAVAGVVVHLPHGWDVFHFGDPMARGYEYSLALILLLLAIILLGPGPLSIDSRLGWGGRMRGGRKEPARGGGGDLDA